MWSAIVVVHLKNGLGIGSRWFTAKSSRVSGSSTWSLRFFVWGLSQAEPAADTLPCLGQQSQKTVAKQKWIEKSLGGEKLPVLESFGRLRELPDKRL